MTSASSRSGTTAIRCSPSRSARACTPAMPRSSVRSSTAGARVRRPHAHHRRRAACRTRVGPRAPRRAAGEPARRAQRHARGGVARRPRALRGIRRRARGARDGPVLVQVARPGYAPVLVCADCRHPARCPHCGGPLHAARPGRGARVRLVRPRGAGLDVPGLLVRRACAWRRRAASAPPTNWAARSPASASSSPTATHPVTQVDARPALVVATRGAEPIADGRLPRRRSCSTATGCCSADDLRIGESCLRWWSNAAALAAPGAPVHLVGVAGPVARALATWTQPAYARAELADRTPLRMPPTVRVAALEGERRAVDAALDALRDAVPALDDDAVLGPVDRDGAVARARALRLRARARRSTESLRASVVSRGPQDAGRTARDAPAAPRNTLRVRVDRARPRSVRNAMRLVFAGTPEPAVPSLRRLAASDHEIAAVVTRRDAPLGRKRVLTPSPVAASADELGIETIRADRLDADATAADRGARSPTSGSSSRTADSCASRCCRPPCTAGSICTSRCSRAGAAQHPCSTPSSPATSDRRERVPARRRTRCRRRLRRGRVPSCPRRDRRDVLADARRRGCRTARTTSSTRSPTAPRSPCRSRASRPTRRSSATMTGGSAGTSRATRCSAGSAGHPRARRAHDRRRHAAQGARRARGAAGCPRARAGRSPRTAARCWSARRTAPIVARPRPAGRQGRHGRGDWWRGLRTRVADGRLMSGAQDSRRVAYETMRAVHESDAYANLLLPTSIAARRARHRRRRTRHRAHLRHAAPPGHLRRGDPDRGGSAASRRSIPRVLDALRLGVHQLLSTRVASHAAVNESVELARAARRARRRRIRQRRAATHVARHPGRLDDAGRRERPVRRRASRPAVLASRLDRARLPRALAAEGRADELEALLTADNAAPRVTMAALPGLAEAPEDARRTPFSPLGFRLGGGDPDATSAGPAGASACRTKARSSPHSPSAARRPSRRESAGSTSARARAARPPCSPPKRSPRRPTRGERDLARACRTRAAGARGGPARGCRSPSRTAATRAEEAPGYDRILVDAPCTGLGALRRRPEARWRKSPADVPELTQLQGELLTAAIGALRPGGIVAYVTCSPHLAETAGVVADVRREFGEALEELDARDVLAAVCRRRSRASRRRTTAPAGRSCGRTGTTPTRCRSRCCGGLSARLSSAHSSRRTRGGSAVDLGAQHHRPRPGCMRASSRRRRSSVAPPASPPASSRSTRQHSLCAGEAELAAEPHDRARLAVAPPRSPGTAMLSCGSSSASRSRSDRISTTALARTLLPCASSRGLKAATPN